MMHGPSDPVLSRHCTACNTYWPALGQYFTACPLCDSPTRSNKEFDSDFETEAVALAHIATVKESRRKHAEFERYYTEVHVPAGARLVEEAIKTAARMTPADLADEFAKLGSSRKEN